MYKFFYFGHNTIDIKSKDTQKMNQKQKQLYKERLWIILNFIVIAVIAYIAINWFTK